MTEQQEIKEQEVQVIKKEYPVYAHSHPYAIAGHRIKMLEDANKALREENAGLRSKEGGQMRWYLFGQRKPTYCKPILVYILIEPVGDANAGHFVEGYFDPRDVFVAVDGKERTLADNARWTEKESFVEFLSEYWPEV